MQCRLQIQLFGTLQLTYNNEPLTRLRKSYRVQQLLAYLILNRDRPSMRTQIAFLFWPDTTEKQALTNLRKLIHDLRKLVPDVDNLICIDADTLQWQPTVPNSLDIEQFEQVLDVSVSQAPDVHTQRAELEKAVTLYHANLLMGHYEEWILAERDRLHNRLITTLEELMRLAEQQRDFRAAIRYGSQLLRYERMHEATYCALIRLYRCCGERGLAIQMYERCERILEEMLDVLPCMETQAEFALVV